MNQQRKIHGRLYLPARARRGFSLLGAQVAFVVFGVTLAGLAPVAVMQLRQLHSLEARRNPDTTYYFVPPTEAWARKLGAAATVSTEQPGPSGATNPTPAYDVQVISLEKSFGDEEATANLSVVGVPQ